MSVNSYNLTVGPNGSVILEPANFLLLITASAPVNVIFQTNAGREQFTNQSAGLRVQRLKNWANCNITGTPGTTVLVYYGIEHPREDAVDFISVIATIAGSVTVLPGLGSANTPTDHADVAVLTGATSTVIPANPLRKSVSIGSLSTNAPATTNLRVRGHGNVVGGEELQAGTWINIPTIAALDVFNGDANTQTYWWQEYT